MKPVAYFPDPFRRGDNILVLTEAYVWEDTTYQKLIPALSNFRAVARPIFEAAAGEKPCQSVPQEPAQGVAARQGALLPARLCTRLRVTCDV